MVQSSKDTGKRAASRTSAFLPDLQASGIGTAEAFGAAWMERMGSLGAEWLRFVAERLQADMETQHDLLRCKNIEDVQRVQAGFFEKAVDQYREETGRIIDICNAAPTVGTDTATDTDEETHSARRHSTPV